MPFKKKEYVAGAIIDELFIYSYTDGKTSKIVFATTFASTTEKLNLYFSEYIEKKIKSNIIYHEQPI